MTYGIKSIRKLSSILHTEKPYPGYAENVGRIVKIILRFNDKEDNKKKCGECMKKNRYLLH